MSSRSLEDLDPLVADKANRLVQLAAAEGIEILVTAKPGESWHNFGLAFDVVPLVNGKAVFDSPFWPRVGELGKQVGLFLKSFKDKPHFEFHPNLTLAEANRRRENNQNMLA